jgi:hypothetical protein
VSLQLGMRLGSVVCDTEVIVVRAPSEDVDLRCGGHPMLPKEAAPSPRCEPLPGYTEGSLLGKRYADDDLGLELLVTKAGAGSLSVSENCLLVKKPKRLPTSD